MNRILVIYTIPLPNNILDVICSFNFYTLEQCINSTKQKYKNVIDNIKETIYDSNSYPTLFSATIIRIHDLLLFVHICNHCGNYLMIMPYSCRCKLRFNGVHHFIQ